MTQNQEHLMQRLENAGLRFNRIEVMKAPINSESPGLELTDNLFFEKA